jgi:hypothetical protein
MASPTAAPTGDQLAGRQRRHQIVDDIALDLADQQREARIGEGVLDHRHDDQARREEVGERHAHHAAPAAAERDGEDRKEQQGRDRRCPHGLHVHLEEPAHLLDIEGLEASPIDALQHRLARGEAHPQRAAVVVGLVVHR